MSTTVNTDLVIYDDLAQTAFLERRQDNLEVFNASSNGAILLDNELIEGDFRKRAFYKVGGSIESRNVNSVDKVTGKKIGAGEAVSVKAPWKYGPYETTEEAFKRRGRSVDEFSEVIGVDVADATLEGYVKYGLKALTAAIGANADMVVTADIETDGKKTLTRGLRKYGDKFNRVVLFVMHSATYFDIVDEAIANKIYEEAGVVVYGGQPGTLGKPVLVTDTMDADAILGLVSGAVTVTESQAPGFRSYDINDQENLAIGYRAEGVVNVDLLGYSWDMGIGSPIDLGSSPVSAINLPSSFWMKPSPPYPSDAPLSGAFHIVNIGPNAWNTQIGFPAYANRILTRSRASANGNFNGWTEFYSTANTTKASDGTLKAASPVVKVFSDGSYQTNYESDGCSVTRLGIGEYLVEGCEGLNSDAAWGGIDGGFDIPTDRNKQPLIWLDYEVNADGSVLVKTYHRTHPEAPAFARNELQGINDGDPVDIPHDQFVSVRVEMPADSLYNQRMIAAELAMTAEEGE